MLFRDRILFDRAGVVADAARDADRMAVAAAVDSGIWRGDRGEFCLERVREFSGDMAAFAANVRLVCGDQYDFVLLKHGRRAIDLRADGGALSSAAISDGRGPVRDWIHTTPAIYI